MTPSPEPLYDLVQKAIDLAIECVDTGEILVPFIITEGSRGEVATIMADSIDESIALARDRIKGYTDSTSAFAFAYDGFITIDGERTDSIYVEASYGNFDHTFIFAQRYNPRQATNPVQRLGNWIYLQNNESRLKL